MRFITYHAVYLNGEIVARSNNIHLATEIAERIGGEVKRTGTPPEGDGRTHPLGSGSNPAHRVTHGTVESEYHYHSTTVREGTE